MLKYRGFQGSKSILEKVEVQVRYLLQQDMLCPFVEYEQSKLLRCLQVIYVVLLYSCTFWFGIHKPYKLYKIEIFVNPCLESLIRIIFPVLHSSWATVKWRANLSSVSLGSYFGFNISSFCNFGLLKVALVTIIHSLPNRKCKTLPWSWRTSYTGRVDLPLPKALHLKQVNLAPSSTNLLKHPRQQHFIIL